MSDFKAFLAQNADRVSEVEIAISPRFKDEMGSAAKWKLRALTSGEDEAIRKACTKRVLVHGKKGVYTNDTDTSEYIGRLVAACITFPDLKSVELQDSYGVKGEDALLKAMLLPGEYTELVNQIQSINGYDLDQEDLVDEAKN